MTDSSASAFNASDASAPGARGAQFSLGAQSVHVWLCPREQVASSDDFKRRVLSRYAAVAPFEWQFTAGVQGKPAILGPLCALDFNLSHSGEWLACAVTAGTPVGVDLEHCRSGRVTLKLARRFFREEEVAALQDCSQASQCDRFYDLWTLKEAAVKARGETLGPGLAARGFELMFPADPQAGAGRIVVSAEGDTDAAHYWLLDPLPAYRLAICWPSAMPLMPQLQVFELYPADGFVALDVPVRAHSASH